MNAKSVVRTWSSRRFRKAFTEALGRRGYGQEGTIADSSAAKADGKPLKGSLEIFCMEGIKTASYDEVQRQALLVVDAVVRLSTKNQRGYICIKHLQP